MNSSIPLSELKNKEKLQYQVAIFFSNFCNFFNNSRIVYLVHIFGLFLIFRCFCSLFLMFGNDDSAPVFFVMGRERE